MRTSTLLQYQHQYAKYLHQAHALWTVQPMCLAALPWGKGVQRHEITQHFFVGPWGSVSTPSARRASFLTRAPPVRVH